MGSSFALPGCSRSGGESRPSGLDDGEIRDPGR